MTRHDFSFTHVEEAYGRLDTAVPGMIKPMFLLLRRQTPAPVPVQRS
ncbi:hypothetical protein [Streptomyces sp. AP-93]|nr:hypothetical protein [Streptomyces sp. AP-93]MCJ0875810.1 hypothetical protein [Streptomyces sp. AP-93]